ncbi:MAG: hypothetical protein WDO19_31825 [Bacteroidota bacterium]
MNILDTIVEYKREEVRKRKIEVSIADLERRDFFNGKTYSLKEFLLNKEKTGIIAEFKRKVAIERNNK